MALAIMSAMSALRACFMLLLSILGGRALSSGRTGGASIGHETAACTRGAEHTSGSTIPYYLLSLAIDGRRKSPPLPAAVNPSLEKDSEIDLGLLNNGESILKSIWGC
jgi:hypothetical protein